MELTTYTKNTVVNHFFRNQAFTPPTTLWVGLFTTPTADDGTGTEVTGGTYARQQVTIGAPSGGVAANTADLVWPNMPAATVSHAAIFNAATGGNMLWHGELPYPIVVEAGKSTRIVQGTMIVSFSPSSTMTTYLRNKIIDRILRNQAYTSPATIYLGVYNDATDESGGGTEDSYVSYARSALVITTPSDGVAFNNLVDVQLVSNAGITHAAVLDASTGGNMMLQGALRSPILTYDGDVIRFEPGDLTLTVR